MDMQEGSPIFHQLLFELCVWKDLIAIVVT